MANLEALKAAARPAIVMPAVFAIADKLIGKPQTSIFAAFGSFAVLLLVEFGGPMRDRFLAYLALAGVGAAFITLGTLCSRHAWLAATAMALVGFLVLFAGSFSSYAAAGATGAMMTFVLPVTIRAPNTAIPDRLEGWGLACAAGIAAVMLLWPARRTAELRRQAAQATRAAADLLDADPEQTAERALTAREAVERLVKRVLGSQHRPTGASTATAALASLPDELEWLVSFLTPDPEAARLDPASAEDITAKAAAGEVLRAAADRLDGLDAAVDLEDLDASREAVAAALLRRLPELQARGLEAATEALEEPFRIRIATYSARQVAGYALSATGADRAVDDAPVPHDHSAARRVLHETEQVALEHASFRSVGLQNSVRGAVGLAIAVYIAQRTGLQHGFWVVLGTLSVLRSNALGTGWSILSALAGTAAGIVVGALLVIAIGSNQTVLWLALPPALLLAAYAPRAISFAAGQAGFTIVLFVLFNIIQPVGWRVGEVRVEDVAIGFAISLGVGLLFWPRGAAALMRRDLAAAYISAADYVASAARQLIDPTDAGAVAQAGHAADLALHRLEDAFRQYLGERTATTVRIEDVGALVAGAARLRRAAQSLAALTEMADGGRLGRCGQNLERELDALQSWYVTLGYALTNRRRVPPAHLRDSEGRTALLACISTAIGQGDPNSDRAGLVLLWASQHLDNLWRLETHIGQRVNSLGWGGTAEAAEAG